MEKEKTSDIYIRDILETFYKSDKIFARNLRILDEDWKIEVTFYIPEYQKSKEHLWHASANQIHEAIMEGVYLAIWVAVDKWRFLNLEGPVTYEDFLKLRAVALYRWVETKHKKEVNQMETVTLTFWIKPNDIKEVKSRFSTVTVSFTGAVQWRAKSVVQINDYVKQTILK